MKKQTKQDRLRQLIKEVGLEKPTTEFSQRLAHVVVTSHAYRQSYATKYKKQDWVGKCIIIVLIALNGLMLVKLNPFRTQPVLCWATCGFIFAFCCVLVWIKKRAVFP